MKITIDIPSFLYVLLYRTYQLKSEYTNDVSIISIPVFIILFIIIDAQHKANLALKQQTRAQDATLSHK